MYDYEKYEINLKKIIQSNYINVHSDQKLGKTPK